MNLRRLIASPRRSGKGSYQLNLAHWKAAGDGPRHRSLSDRAMFAYGSRLCENASLDLILGIRFSRDLREDQMKRFVEGADRVQSTLFPECVADWIGEDNPVRVIEVFVDELDLAELGFSGVDPEVTGRPSYHPSVLLKLYIYGYLNRVQSSRRLEREAGRNVE